MNSHFNIYQSSTAKERPPVSHKIREYFEGFITENVLKGKKIIYGGNWKVILAIHFTERGPKTLFEKMVLIKGVRTITSEQTKLYQVFILTESIQGSSNPLLTTIELMYEAITLFFTTTYKKVKPDFMAALWKQVDLGYLLSLPYPAPFWDQKYVADEQSYNEEQDGVIRPTTIEEQAQYVGYKGKLENGK